MNVEVTPVGEMVSVLHDRISEENRILWYRGHRDASWALVPVVKRGYSEDERTLTHTFRSRAGTRMWWELHRQRYELVTAQYVLDEANTGNVSLAAERLKHLAGIPLVPLGGEIDQLAAEIVSRAILPADAIVDALHIACAAVNRIDYLLIWNCKHIANPMILPRVFRVLDDFGLPFPVICTPKNMLDEYDDEESS